MTVVPTWVPRVWYLYSYSRWVLHPSGWVVPISTNGGDTTSEGDSWRRPRESRSKGKSRSLASNLLYDLITITFRYPCLEGVCFFPLGTLTPGPDYFTEGSSVCYWGMLIFEGHKRPNTTVDCTTPFFLLLFNLRFLPSTDPPFSEKGTRLSKKKLSPFFWENR